MPNEDGCVYCCTEYVLKSSGKAQRKSLETHTENPQEHCLCYPFVQHRTTPKPTTTIAKPTLTKVHRNPQDQQQQPSLQEHHLDHPNPPPHQNPHWKLPSKKTHNKTHKTRNSIHLPVNTIQSTPLPSTAPRPNSPLYQGLGILISKFGWGSSEESIVRWWWQWSEA